MKYILSVLAFVISVATFSQELKKNNIPYYQVPEYSETFTAGTMAARMVDALGFRFHWASKNLTNKDLKYKPNSESRSTGETIDHILDLSYIIVNSTLKKSNGKVDKSAMSYEDKRKQTLINLKTAADILRNSDDISQYKIIFGTTEIPFWNQVNGPIADAIWHCGQLASYRRSSGNPINSNVDHFRGTVKE
ncbi:hypothetical protein [uncultured Psychroserpens sp.]|uniref:hypothetical protein n=1 Tax=uncultured Psychroserpens sp. TaxID=255436 RepID=UPI002634918E|nr:hypothetical protein [uncultured Psychroserpens sp.]